MWLSKQFFAPQQTPATPPRVAPPLAQAWEGVAALQGQPAVPSLTTAQAYAEANRLVKAWTTNPHDPYAYWIRVRLGLLEERLLQAPDLAEKNYQAVVHHGAFDEVEAQALYQLGMMQWNKEVQAGPAATHQATSTFSTIWVRNRRAPSLLSLGWWKANLLHIPQPPTFTELNIWVPDRRSATPGSAASSPPVNSEPQPALRSPASLSPAGSSLAKVTLRDVLFPKTTPDPPAILERADQYYSTQILYLVFNTGVRAFGSQPAFSYGLALLLFAALTRLVMQPVNKKQYESMRGMAIIAPQMKKIQEKYKGKGDQQSQMQMMKEIRELQSRHGVNPMIGCGLAIVQLPIFFFVVYPMISGYEPHLQLVGASFLWIRDLAQPDLPLLVIYAASMLFSFRMSSVPATDETQRQQQMMMGIMMPLLFPLILSTYPSAFTLYWMTFNVISTVFQWRMVKAADPHKDFWDTMLGRGLQPAVAGAADPAQVIPPRPRGNARIVEAKSVEAAPTRVKSLAPDQEAAAVSPDGDQSPARVRPGAAGKSVRRRRH